MDIAIGELSRRTGVKVPTIRYYEQVGLMPVPPGRPGLSAAMARAMSGG